MDVFLTFGDAESVIAARDEVIQRYEQIGVIFAGSRQQILFGVPARRLRQTRGLEIRPLERFCKHTRERTINDTEYENA